MNNLKDILRQHHGLSLWRDDVAAAIRGARARYRTFCNGRRRQACPADHCRTISTKERSGTLQQFTPVFLIRLYGGACGSVSAIPVVERLPGSPGRSALAGAAGMPCAASRSGAPAGATPAAGRSFRRRKGRHRHPRPRRARGPAAACPETRVVSVCDRGGLPADVGEGGGGTCLWECAASLPAPAAVDLTIPASGGPGAPRTAGDTRGGGRGPAAEARPRQGAGHDVRRLRHRGGHGGRRGAAAPAADGHRTAGGGGGGLHAHPHRPGVAAREAGHRDMVPDPEVRHPHQGPQAGHRRRPPTDAPGGRRREWNHAYRCGML